MKAVRVSGAKKSAGEPFFAEFCSFNLAAAAMAALRCASINADPSSVVKALAVLPPITAPDFVRPMTDPTDAAGYALAIAANCLAKSGLKYLDC